MSNNSVIVIEPSTTWYAFKNTCDHLKSYNSNIRTCSGDVCLKKKGRNGGEAALGSCRLSACPDLKAKP